MNNYTVLVGNIGMVLDCQNKAEAEATYREYVSQSKTGVGRAGGETVSFFKNGELFKEYIGTRDITESERFG